MDLDRIRACIEINELPSFALVQSICPGEGWIEYKMVLKEEREMRQTRAYSKETRSAFAAGLEPGKCFGVYCGGSGEVTHKFFWLAEALPESKQSNRVVFKADSADPNWDIKRGADVLNVQWLERVDADAHPLKFEPGAVQTIALSSVLPKKVAEFERTTTNRRYLKGSDEGEYIEMCRHIREQQPNWDIKTYASSLAARKAEKKRKRACSELQAS